METSQKIIVVIPAYQAVATIKEVFSRLPAEMLQKNVTYLVVNDGSSDGTEQAVQEVMMQMANVQLIAHEVNRGYAQAQKTGFRAALDQDADIIALLHADGQYAPELLPQLLGPLERDEADVVQGSRMVRAKDALRGGMPLYKWIANRVLSRLENVVFGMKLAEYHSGYMLYSRKTLETVPFERLSHTFHFDGEMLFMANRKGLRIKELPIPTHYGREKSHLRPVRYGVDVLRILVRYLLGRYNF